MTVHLYWKDPYKTDFNAKVVEISQNGIILDKTYFYPHGGGQVSDKGKIIHGKSVFHIKDITSTDEGIIHFVKESIENLNIGDKISANIDWDYRYGLMKAHTSQHILSSQVLSYSGARTTKVQIKSEEVSLNLDQTITLEQLEKILTHVNSMCTYKGLDVSQKIISYEEAFSLKQKIRGEFIPKKNEIRLIQIEDLDLICCGGTHLDNTSEIGPLFIFKFTGDGIRYFIGKKAIQSLSAHNLNLLNLAESMNTSLDRLNKLVIKNIKKMDLIEKESEILKLKYLKQLKNNPERKIGNISLFYLEFEIDKKILNKVFDEFPPHSLLIQKPSVNRIILLSNNKDLSAQQIIKSLNERYNGKGGGSPWYAQGVLEYPPNNIINEIKELIEEKNE